ncbi:Kinesin-like protein b, partial [Operophtera brumata]
RDSLLSRADHDELDSSRPGSVLARATRRRRQSSHDLHRSVTPHAPSPTASLLRTRARGLKGKIQRIGRRNQVMELKTKADTTSSSLSCMAKPSVEKNKKLTRTIEELRFTKLDLKNTLGKMQKALERNSAKDNRYSCTEELKELRTRYKELDEECETCASYLKEREEQCRLLKEAKAAL